MLFSGAPVEAGASRGHFVLAVPRREADRLPEVRAMAIRLEAEEAPVLNTIRLRRGLLMASDHHLARYLKYAEEFPCSLPSQR